MDDRLDLRPTAEQYRAFAEYLPEAHSWYKHLPLLEGSPFVVFVAPDAGTGRLVAVPETAPDGGVTGYKLVMPEEGSAYTEAHPRLHYGWRTTEEYRRRFGFLDFGRRHDPREPYGRDAGSATELPDGLAERCGFVLYPYVHPTFEEAVGWHVHAEAIERLENGAPHPAREEVLELHRLARALDATWPELSEPEQGWVIDEETGEGSAAPEKPSSAFSRYRDLRARVAAVSGPLQSREAAKVRKALAELDEWLLQGRAPA